jgi:hypothetical protein
VLTRPTRRRPQVRTRDKHFWIVVRWVRRDWRRHLVLVRPETVIYWHRQSWKLVWRWRSRARLGRPRLEAEVRALIATMARENPTWGSERIRGELRKLGIVVSKRSVQRYRRRGPAGPPRQSWRTFLANHRPQIWAADLFTVQTLTFKTLYVPLFITHGRRELVHWNVTAHPPAAWVWRQVTEATRGAGRPSISCEIGTPSPAATSPRGPDAWAARPGSRRSARRGRMPSSNGSWGPFVASAWTT